jgi:hypothetical protein
MIFIRKAKLKTINLDIHKNIQIKGAERPNYNYHHEEREEHEGLQMVHNSQDVGYGIWDVEAANNHDTKLPSLRGACDEAIQNKQPAAKSPASSRYLIAGSRLNSQKSHR